MSTKLKTFTDVLGDPDEIGNSQPLSLSSVEDSQSQCPSRNIVDLRADKIACDEAQSNERPAKGTGQYGEFRSVEEIDSKYRSVFEYPFFNLVQSRVIDDALYSDKSMVICAPTGSGKTIVFELAIVHLLMELEDSNEHHDFKIIYMAPVKALCTERLAEWYAKFTKLGLLCIEVTGDTDVDFSQLKPYRIIITTPEKWDMLTRRWRDHRQLVEVIKLFLIDEVHILNDSTRGPVLEAVVSRMKTIETSVQSTYRIEKLQKQYQNTESFEGYSESGVSPNIRFVAVSATVSNPEDVAAWLGTADKPAVYYKFGDECRPVKLRRVVEGYPCAEGTSIFKFDIILNYKLWPIIQKYHDGKPTLIFCNTRKSVALTAETLSRVITINFSPEQNARLQTLASKIKTKKLQALVLSGVGCHHAGLLFEERTSIEQAFRNRDLPILITTTTLAMGVNLPAHLVIVKNTQQYVSGAYQEYSISTVLQMVGRAGRPQFDTEATAVIMTRLCDKQRYQALVGGCEPLQSYLHKRLPENLNSEAALGTVTDVAQCVQWLRSTFLSVRAAKDPKRYLGLPQAAPQHQISKKIEELCVKAMNGLASSGLITMDEACCIESTEAGRLMSIYYLDLETMKHIMKIDGSESLERLLWIVCESHELADMHLRMDERRCLNLLNRNNTASTIRYPMKGKITTRQMKLNCVIQASLGCLPIPDPSLNQEATKIMRIADRICKCLVAYVTRPALVSQQPKFYSAVLNTIILAKCVAANLWENSPFVSKQLRGIGPTFSTLLATAGKVNFMLLEESHPRDLERIMNKGPPAGNIIRKQISLLPKYQLTLTPIDERSVSIQLNLLNQNNLAENIEHLTAGPSHTSYVIIGDSENILLLLMSFTDKDLISVYDGNITYQITRKHGFEHKIFVHCVSSAFAGIDAQSEYVFQNIEPQMNSPQSGNTEETIKRTIKQTTITDTFRERKRKNTDNEIAQSKEKKKRESALFEKFKNLKETFGKTTKVLKQDLNKSAVMSSKILQELGHRQTQVVDSTTNIEEQRHECIEPVKSTFFEETDTYEINEEDFMNDEFMDDDKVNNMINEIESEMEVGEHKRTKLYNTSENDIVIQKAMKSVNEKYSSDKNINPRTENYKPIEGIKKRGTKSTNQKSNYSFIELLEKNVDLSEEDPVAKEQNTFSDTIRAYIDKYLQKTENHIKVPDKILTDLINSPERQNNREHEIDIEKRNKQDTVDEPLLKPSVQNIERITTKETQLTNNDKINLSSVIENIDLTTDYEQRNTQSVNAASVTTIISESKGVDKVGVIDQNEKKDFENELVSQHDVAPLTLNLNESKKSDDDRVIESTINKCPDSLISTEDFMELDGEYKFPEVELYKNNKGTEIDSSNNHIASAIGQSDPQQILSESLPNNLPGTNYLNSEKKTTSIEQKKGGENVNHKLFINLPSTSCLISEKEDENHSVQPKKSEEIGNNNINRAFSTTTSHVTVFQEKQALPAKESREDFYKDERSITAPCISFKTHIPLKSASQSNFYNNKLPAADFTEVCHSESGILELPHIVTPKLSQTYSFRKQPAFTQQHYNKFPYGMPSHITEIQEKQQLQENVQLDSNKATREVLTNNASFTRGFENEPEYSQRRNNFTDPNSQNNCTTSNYSFLSNKIDVSTKETEDHVVRIIRKLRIDMDIIVSQEKKAPRSGNEKVTDKGLVLYTPRDFHKSESVGLPHCIENDNRIPAICSSEFETELGKAEIIHETQNLKTSIEPMDITSNSQQGTEEYNQNVKENTDSNNERYKTFYTENKVENYSVGSKANNVQSILQKYSQNMRKNNTKTVHLLSQTTTNVKSFSKKEKPKRPFKISDINHVIAALPDTIIEKTDSMEDNKPSQELHYIQHDHDIISQILPNFTAKQQDIEVEVNMFREQNKNESIHGTVEDIPDCGDFEKSLEEKETNIDHIMFNPKTLLQCFGKDSPDIVPPPPEFCDNLNETSDAVEDLTLSMDCYEPMQWDDDENDTFFTEANQSIFDDTQVELTPSREIETWNLTNEEGNCKTYASPYSFTILRKNREHTARCSQNQLQQNVTATLPRHNKLKQFKYRDKLKLNPK